MSVFGSRLRKLRGKQSIDELVKKLNEKYKTKISKSMISRYENGQSDPKMEVVRILADYFNVSADYLIGLEKKNNINTITVHHDDEEWTELEKMANREEILTKNDENLPELTSKDERDIQKKLEEIINSLNSTDGYAALDGKTIDEIDEEDRELLIASLENSLRLAKRIAKQKFTPKKYKK